MATTDRNYSKELEKYKKHLSAASENEQNLK